MAQPFMGTVYDPLYSSTMLYKQSASDVKTFQIQCNPPGVITTRPVHIYPYVSSSEIASQSLTSVIEPIVSSNTMSPTFKSDDMPTLSHYPGLYNFNIFIPNGEYDEAKRKGQTCVTDEHGKHQLFTKPQPHYWRLNYSVNTSMPTPNAYIRIVPVYGDPEKAQCILERCPKHKEALTDDNVWKNRSMLIVEKTSAQYFQDSTSKRVCVMMPFEKHAEGQPYSSVNCQFACYNSCFNQDAGGRKTLYLIITLEILDSKSSKFEVLGRQCLQFRSCACPSRDWRDKKMRSDTDPAPKIKERRIKLEEKGTIFKSTPINIGGKDAIIRVLPSLPGINEAINALVSGYLFSRASNNGENMDAINDVFRQLKNVENCIIAQFTSSYEPNQFDVKSRSLSPAESQVSLINNSTPVAYTDFNTLFPDNYTNYIVRPIQPQVLQSYSTQTSYNDFQSPYSDIKMPTETTPINFDDLPAVVERGYGR